MSPAEETDDMKYLVSLLLLVLLVVSRASAEGDSHRLWDENLGPSVTDEQFKPLSDFFGDSNWFSGETLAKEVTMKAYQRNILPEEVLEVAGRNPQGFFDALLVEIANTNSLKVTNGSVSARELRQREALIIPSKARFLAAAETADAKIAHPEPAPVQADAEDTIVTIDGGMVPGTTVPVSETGEVQKVGKPVNLRPDPELFPQVSTEIPTVEVPKTSVKTPTARPTQSDCSAVQVSPELAAIGVVATCALDASARAETSVAEVQAFGSQIAELKRGQDELRETAENAVTPEELEERLKPLQTKAEAEEQQRQNEARFATKKDLEDVEERMRSSLKNFAIGFENFSWGARIAMFIAGPVIVIGALWILWFVSKPILLPLWRGIASIPRLVSGWRRKQPLKAQTKREEPESTSEVLEGEIVSGEAA